MVAEFLARARERGDVWIARAGEIADHAEATIPAGETRRIDLPRFD
jgi:hypothetical protein